MTFLIGHIHGTGGFIDWLVWKIVQANIVNKKMCGSLLSAFLGFNFHF